MKKSTIFYLSLLLISLVCCKDNDESPTYKKEDLIGKWKLNQTSTPTDDCTNEEQELEITASELKFTSRCNGGTPTTITVTYTFDNKNTLTYEFIGEMKLVITQLTPTTLKVNQYWMGQKLGTGTYNRI